MDLEVMSMGKSIKSLAYFILLIFAFLVCASGSIAQQEYVNPIDAHKYIGMEKTVCGTVASATYAIRTKGRPTFLNLDQPYPKQILRFSFGDLTGISLRILRRHFLKGKGFALLVS